VPKKERGLGKGLDALFSSGLDLDTEEGIQVIELEIDRIAPRSEQPRKAFDEKALLELAQSIKEHGMLQPILVRPIDDFYEIIAGERRFRAAKLAGIEVIPAVIREIDDIQSAEISLIENLQREDLSIIEEAWAYKKLIESYGYTQELVAERIGKSRSHVANTIRLLSLPQEVLDMLDKRLITAGHARSVLSLEDESEQVAAAKEIVSGRLSVRKTEEHVKNKKKELSKTPKKPAEIIELEDRLQEYFGTQTEIIPGKKKGKVVISYYSDEDLERIIEMLLGSS